MGKQKNIDMSIIPDDVSNKAEFEVNSQDLRDKEQEKVKKVDKVDKVKKVVKEKKDETEGETKKADQDKNKGEKGKKGDKGTEKAKKTTQKVSTAPQGHKKPLHGKLYREAKKLVDNTKLYALDEALEILPKTANKKFTESVEMHLKLGIKGGKGESGLRTTVKFPHSTGKKMRIAVLTAKPEIAKKAGADIAGGDDLVTTIKTGKTDFDILIAEPAMMAKIGPLAKMLGPKGLMPNPKSGTITDDIEGTVKELAGGRVEFKSDAGGSVHILLGKVKDPASDLKENILGFIEAVKTAPGVSFKGELIRSATICSSMGPGIKIDPASFVLKK